MSYPGKSRAKAAHESGLPGRALQKRMAPRIWPRTCADTVTEGFISEAIDTADEFFGTRPDLNEVRRAVAKNPRTTTRQISAEKSAYLLPPTRPINLEKLGRIHLTESCPPCTTLHNPVR